MALRQILSGIIVALLALTLSPTESSMAESRPNSAEERQILAVIEEMADGRLGMSAPTDDARLLRVLATTMNAQRVVEIGTFKGYSALWMSLALTATGGTLTTFEIDADRAAESRARFQKAGVDDIVTVVVGDAHETITQLDGPIDLAFIDADKSGYLDYLRKLRPLMRAGGLIAAHNMNFPRPDPAFIEAITTDPGLETVFVNMDGSGMALTVIKP